MPLQTGLASVRSTVTRCAQQPHYDGTKPDDTDAVRHRKRFARKVCLEFLEKISGGDPEILLHELGYATVGGDLSERLKKAEKVVQNIGVMYESLGKKDVREKRTLLALVAEEYHWRELKRPDTADQLGFGYSSLGQLAAISAERHVEEHGVVWVTEAHVPKLGGPKGHSEEKLEKARSLLERAAAVKPGAKPGTKELLKRRTHVYREIKHATGVGKTKCGLLLREMKHIKNPKRITGGCHRCADYGLSLERLLGYMGKLENDRGIEDTELESVQQRFDRLTSFSSGDPRKLQAEEEEQLRVLKVSMEALGVHRHVAEVQHKAEDEQVQPAELKAGQAVLRADFMSDPRIGKEHSETSDKFYKYMPVGLFGMSVYLPPKGDEATTEEEKPVMVHVLSSSTGKTAFDAVMAIDHAVMFIKKEYPMRWTKVRMLKMWFDTGKHFRANCFLASIPAAAWTSTLLEIHAQFSERKHGKDEWVDGSFQKVHQAVVDGVFEVDVQTPEQLSILLQMYRERGKKTKQAAPKRHVKDERVREWQAPSKYHAIVGEWAGPRQEGSFATLTDVKFESTYALRYFREDTTQEFRFQDLGLSNQVPSSAWVPLGSVCEAVDRPPAQGGAPTVKEARVQQRDFTNLSHETRLRHRLEAKVGKIGDSDPLPLPVAKAGIGVPPADPYGKHGSATLIDLTGVQHKASLVKAHARVKGAQFRLYYDPTGMWQSGSFQGVLTEVAWLEESDGIGGECLVMRVYTGVRTIEHVVRTEWVAEQERLGRLRFVQPGGAGARTADEVATLIDRGRTAKKPPTPVRCQKCSKWRLTTEWTPRLFVCEDIKLTCKKRRSDDWDLRDLEEEWGSAAKYACA